MGSSPAGPVGPGVGPAGQTKADVSPGGVTNFCFAREDEMFLCAEQKLWRVYFKPDMDGRRWKNQTASMEVNPEEHNFI